MICRTVTEPRISVRRRRSILAVAPGGDGRLPLRGCADCARDPEITDRCDAASEVTKPIESR